MNYLYHIYESKEFVLKCAAARQCEWQCVTVCAVFLAKYVCDSAHSSQRLSSGSAAACSSAAMRSVRGCVWQFALQCAAVHAAVGVVWQCARQCAAVQQCGSVRLSGSEHIFK